MLNLNRATIAGRLGKDAETRTTGTGKQVTTFSLATSERYKEGDEWKSGPTQWHNIVCWGWQSEIAQEFIKADAVYVEGKIQYREWEDKDGNKRNTTEIIAFSCWKLAPAAKSKEVKQERPAQQREHQPPPPEDDIPF